MSFQLPSPSVCIRAASSDARDAGLAPEIRAWSCAAGPESCAAVFLTPLCVAARRGLFDGLYGFCGWSFKADGTVYIKNATKYGQCAGTINQTSTHIPGGADVLGECKRQGMDFQPVMGLDDWRVSTYP